ncbi:amidohydrolase [Sandaracinobacteroides hominis]|uniref:amidohydrolase n=1 Tax=Sandaracinobacteroides hominis TaxID=2780086 RepID=UPI001F1DD507|nr:amidohydrolase [Sandaracinobacteroides hominis]
MRNRSVFLVAAALCAGWAGAGAPAMATDVKAVQKAVAEDWNGYLGPLFDYFHRNPELSFVETRTAARMAKELRTVPGMVVTEKVGGTGVVGVLKNGAGPTVLVRADMDGLPVQERSGLANASTVRQKDRNGVEQPVMHACGHDTHITALLGTARRLAALKTDWSGTVIFVVQPAEEILVGAKAMMNDNLYQRFGKPDYALGFHVAAGMPTGRVAVQEGVTYSAADTIDIVVHGVGAHGASPHMGKDPVVMGSQIVLGMQTMLGRSIAPLRPAVITVGAFHAGTKHNIISERAELSVTARADDLETRDAVIAGIRRVAAGVGEEWGMSGAQAPEVKVREDERAIPNVNDPELTKRLRTALSEAFGPEILFDAPRQGMGSEDFPFLVGDGVKSVYYGVGGTPQADIDAERKGGPAVAGHHSPLFKVDGEQAVKTGAQTMTVSVLELLGRKS